MENDLRLGREIVRGGLRPRVRRCGGVFDARLPAGAISRRAWLELFAGAAILAAVLPNWLAARTQAAELSKAGRPNVVMILSDDQGWGDYGFMGHSQIKTPNLDKLAASGITFTRGYDSAPVCMPSLASMVTGLHVYQHKITGLNVKPPNAKQARQTMDNFIKAVPTVPRLLAAQGYRCLQTGKWWHGSFATGGFTEGMTHGDPERGGEHGDEGLAIGRSTMQPIYNFIDSCTSANTPFLVWYAPMLPHNPHNPPKEILDKYKGKDPSEEVVKYWAMCEWFDQTCGQLIDYLDKKGVRDNTLIVYASDNGWIQLPDAKKFAERSKFSPYEGGIRTPILVSWPHRIKPLRDETHPVNIIDFAPTLLRACGLQPISAMQGVDLTDAQAVADRKAVFGAAYNGGQAFGGMVYIDNVEDPDRGLHYQYVISGDWKLILAHPLALEYFKDLGKVQLFNIVADPDEKKNLAAANPEKVTELSDMIRTWYGH